MQSVPKIRASVWSSLYTHKPEKLTVLLMMDRPKGESFWWMSSTSASASWREVTINVPLGLVSSLIGCRPYQAQDSIPLHIVSSTLMVTSTSVGSYRARVSSNSSGSSATTANCLAGIPLRSGESPYRPKAVPILPSFRAANTMDRTMFRARVLWNIPRYTTSTATVLMAIPPIFLVNFD